MAIPELMDIEDFDLETLVGLAERLALEESDGHLTIMRFASGWKVFLQTPDPDAGGGGEEIADAPVFDSLKEALVDLLEGDVDGDVE
jgi:hypothetical protein